MTFITRPMLPSAPVNNDRLIIFQRSHHQVSCEASVEDGQHRNHFVTGKRSLPDSKLKFYTQFVGQIVSLSDSLVIKS